LKNIPEHLPPSMRKQLEEFREQVNTALGKAHGNTAGDQSATLYKKFDKDGNFEKHGVTQCDPPSKRYTKKEIDGGEVRREARGPRSEMLKKERDLVETDPGPKNREPWAGKQKPMP